MNALVRPLVFAFVLLMFSGNASAFLMAAIGVDKSVQNAAHEARATISHARLEAQMLIEHGNTAAKERLEQIDGIVSKAINDIALLEDKTSKDILSIIDRVERSVSKIESTLITDIRSLIWETECGAKRVLIEDMQTLLGDLGEFVGTSKINISSPFSEKNNSIFCLWCKDAGEFVVKKPFGETYKDVKNYILKSIDENLDDESPAHSIVGSYEYLSSFALKTSCFYPGGSKQFIREHIKYQALANQWTNLLIVEI